MKSLTALACLLAGSLALAQAPPRREVPKPGVCPLPILPALPAATDTSFYANTNVPHGTLEKVSYKNYAGADKRMHIYLPPDYAKNPSAKYPVLYLNHGGGDDDSKWSNTDPKSGGHAHLILDNLIAAGKAKPMIIVMPHTRCSVPTPPVPGTDDACTQEYLKDIIPYVESHYRARPGRESRALAGLSMGGFVVMNTGLPHLDTFSELYVYSSGYFPEQQKAFEENFQQLLKDPKTNDLFRVPFYMGQGETDIALKNGQGVMAVINKYAIRNFWVLSTGGHEWMNWRRYLHQTAQIMFPDCTQPQVALGARRAPVLKSDGLQFKDLNRNGKLDRYEDWRLPAQQRAADLITQMTSEEKAGLMIHSSLAGFTGPGGVVLDAPPPPRPGAAPGFAPPRREGVAPMDRPTPNELILNRNVRWILLRPNATEPPEITARFNNGLQELAEGSRLGIPLALSTDPRHAVSRNPAAPPPNISQWPDQLGLAATGEPGLVYQSARTAAQELRALGLSVTLSPMADVVTEPRWNRIAGTFGEDAATVSSLVRAYIAGMQGNALTPESVLCVTKHFPGDGPVKEGLDPHNDFGKWQIYPGNHFDHHLIPFRAAFESGTGGIMPGYAIPQGYDTVGMNFSKVIVGDMLRGKFAYQGLVVTDWLRNMPWGVESLSEKERQLRMVQAGVDQIGGDNDPKYILESVKDGTLTAARLDESARRVLKPMFELGLFDNPYVDPERAKAVVASKPMMDAGAAAQRKSVVVLKNGKSLLPAAPGRKLYVENINKEKAAAYGTLVDDPKQADLAIIAVNAPFETHKGGASFFPGAKEGTLAYAGADNAAELAKIRQLTASGTPVVVAMFMDRPAVLTEFIDQAAAVLAHFNVSDAALLDVIFGNAAATGKLPLDLPRDMESVRKQKEDVPHDLDNPLFKTGFGITYPARAR
ncbi:MAG: glycoside hydrolase family 3 C-terminal domain-containing protein [Bryobacterales bacterium]|nr:glycoside hydrolase family 3 C-terminal domain-containing protein [Bryobacterales bacterium]